MTSSLTVQVHLRTPKNITDVQHFIVTACMRSSGLLVVNNRQDTWALADDYNITSSVC